MFRALVLCVIGVVAIRAMPYHHYHRPGHFHHHHHHHHHPGPHHQFGQARRPGHNHGHWYPHGHSHPYPHNHPTGFYPPGHTLHNHDNWNPPPGFPGHRPCNPPPGHAGHVHGYSNPPHGYPGHVHNCAILSSSEPTLTTPKPTTVMPTTAEPSTTTPEPSITTPEPSTTTPEPLTITPEPAMATPEPTTTEISVPEYFTGVQELQPFPDKGEPTFIVQKPNQSISQTNNTNDAVFIPVNFPVFVIRPEENEILGSKETDSQYDQKKDRTSDVVIVLVPENKKPDDSKPVVDQNTEDHIIVVNSDCLKGKDPKCHIDSNNNSTKDDVLGVIEQVLVGAGASLPEQEPNSIENELSKNISDFINSNQDELKSDDDVIKLEDKSAEATTVRVDVNVPWSSVDDISTAFEKSENEAKDMNQPDTDDLLSHVKPEFDGMTIRDQVETVDLNTNEKRDVTEYDRDIVKKIFGNGAPKSVNPLDDGKHSLEELLAIQREINAHIEKGLQTYYENKSSENKNTDVKPVDCSEQNIRDTVDLRFKNKCIEELKTNGGGSTNSQPEITKSELRFGVRN